MQKILNYKILEKVYQTDYSEEYRVTPYNSNRVLLLKLIKNFNFTTRNILYFKKTYNIIKTLKLEGILKIIDIFKYKNSYGVVQENFKGLPLSRFIDMIKNDITSFLNIAIQITDTLGQLHNQDIIHNNIKPSNILYDKRTGSIKITDFGINQMLGNVHFYINRDEHTLSFYQYTSPEHSGRMNYQVDYRSDLYSLGITFYELICGKVPFSSDDPIELVHMHIAKKPIPPVKINQDVPVVISNIIMKLLSKIPEERYQNCFGLLADLNYCQKELETKTIITPFELATHDIPLHFSYPQVIIGRDAEFTKIENQFQHVTTGPKKILFVTGKTGVGKTTLIDAIQPVFWTARAFIITGKYDIHQQEISYSAIIQGLRTFVVQLLTETETKISIWKKLIAEQIGHNMHLIIDMIPELTMIVGNQGNNLGSGNGEFTHEYLISLKKLIKIFAVKEHPLVLFLDDLQWVDSGSLYLINSILTDPAFNYLFFIGIYRKDNIQENHIINSLFSELDKMTIPYETMELASLSGTEVNTLMSHFFNYDKRKCFPISEIIFNKTNGNPLFINQFLKKMYDKKIISIDKKTGWTWDLKSAHEMNVTDNVAQIIENKFYTLSEKTQKILKLCSCIGNKFNMETVSGMLHISIDEVILQLNIAVIEGFISISGHEYRFNHNRVLETIYLLIPQEQKIEYHFSIGNYLLQQYSTTELDKKILKVIHYLNNAKNKYTTVTQRTFLAELNLKAALKAKTTSSYNSAIHYVDVGLSLLDSSFWEKNYSLIFSLYYESVELAFLLRRHYEVTEIISQVKDHVDNINDLIKIDTIKIKSTTNNRKNDKAIATGINLLKKMDCRLPHHPKYFTLMASRIISTILLFTVSFKRIPSLSTILIRKKDEIVKLLLLLLTPSRQINPKLYEIIIRKILYYILRFGHITRSSVIFALYAELLITKTGNIRNAHKFAKMALQISKQANNTIIQKETEYYVYGYIFPFTRHIKDCIKPIHQYLRIQTGPDETVDKTSIEHTYLWYMFFSSANLDSIIDGSLPNTNNPEVLPVRLIHNLRDPNIEAPIDLDYNKIDKLTETDNQTLKNNIITECYFYFSKILLCCIFRKYENGFIYVQKIKKIERAVKGHFIYPLILFYSSLCYLNIIVHNTSRLKKHRLLREVKKNQKKTTPWITHAPANFLHLYLLIKSEISRVQEKEYKAFTNYENALQDVVVNNFIHHEAMIREHAAEFHLDRGHTAMGASYLKQAYACYQQWGAKRKLIDLENRHKDLLTEESANIFNNTSDVKPHESMDLTTIFKLSRAVASDLNLEKLLKTIITIALENAGAQNGLLVLKDDQNAGLFVYAEGSVETVSILGLKQPVENYKDMPLGIINFVRKTQESLVLHNASEKGMFKHDPYIITKQARSVLCSPILHKGIFQGILYLENNLMKNAFTEDRVQLLNILLPQVAISIENLRLLEQRENAAKLQRELEIGVKIQKSLLPQNPVIHGYDIYAHVQPSEKVTGDYYDVINTEQKDWIIIGDAAGHGINAGLIMMMVQTSIHVIINQTPNIQPSQLLAKINSTITRNIQLLIENRYMTITVFSLDKDGVLTYSGLHQNILIYRQKTQTLDVLETDGIWIGIIDDIENILIDKTLRLNPGDTMLLFTDGITEAWTQDSIAGQREAVYDMFGEKKLQTIFFENSEKELTKITSTIIDALNEYKIEDDITLLLIRKNKENT